jgi:hypothetical protein
MVEELENMEAAYLQPATERLRQEQEQLEAETCALEALIRRKEALAGRVKALVESQAERQAREVQALTEQLKRLENG